MTSKKILTLVGIYGLWILLLMLWTYTAFQVQNLVVYLGILVVNNDSLRPTGWSTDTITGINRCGFLILGSLWLGMAVFTERYLREGAAEQQLLRCALQLALIGAAIYLLSTGLLYMLS